MCIGASGDDRDDCMSDTPSLAERLRGALVMAPMTKGSNLPFRQLCAEYGARVMMSEMAVARRLKQKRSSEFALIRRFEGEDCFGVQLAGRKADEMAWAAALVESRGADLVDVNLGCPIDHFTRKGMGAALAREPNRVRRIVEAMKAAVSRVPVTVKIRLGWNDRDLNYMKVAQAAVDGGADAVFVHGRTRDARYRLEANWAIIGEIANALPVPVVGNGDILFPHEVTRAIEQTSCTAVMAARGALIKPWLFREVSEGYIDMGGDERLAMYRRYVALALPTGEPTTTVARACASSWSGTWDGGAATCRSVPTGRGRPCRNARARWERGRHSRRCSRG